MLFCPGLSTRQSGESMQTLPPRHNRPPRIPASPARTVVGLALLLPALLCCISQLLLPTVNTLLMSLQETNIFASEREYVGLQNYAALFGDDGFWRAAGFTLTILFVRLLVVSIVPLILAW